MVFIFLLTASSCLQQENNLVFVQFENGSDDLVREKISLAFLTLLPQDNVICLRVYSNNTCAGHEQLLNLIVLWACIDSRSLIHLKFPTFDSFVGDAKEFSWLFAGNNFFEDFFLIKELSYPFSSFFFMDMNFIFDYFCVCSLI